MTVKINIGKGTRAVLFVAVFSISSICTIYVPVILYLLFRRDWILGLLATTVLIGVGVIVKAHGLPALGRLSVDVHRGLKIGFVVTFLGTLAFVAIVSFIVWQLQGIQ